MGEIYSFFDYFKYLDNPMGCLLFKAGFKKEITVKSKDFTQLITIKNPSSLNRLMNAFVCGVNDYDGLINFIYEIESAKEIIDWGDIKIYNQFNLPIGSFYERFHEGYWDSFGINFNGRVVIDVGSNAGDSSLFFASNGAEVFAFEPVIELHELALKNTSLNDNLKDKVHFFNCAVSNKRGKINIDLMDSTSVYTSSVNQKHFYDVDVITIADILRKYNVKPDILKMDCEGCEFGIIEGSDLSMFNDIIFEHHSKMVKKEYNSLVKKLENECFKIKKYDSFSFDFDDMGFIHAYK